MHMTGSSFPNFEGKDSVRPIRLAGDELTILNPAGAVAGTSVNVVWKRAK